MEECKDNGEFLGWRLRRLTSLTFIHAVHGPKKFVEQTECIVNMNSAGRLCKEDPDSIQITPQVHYTLTAVIEVRGGA